MGRSHGSSCTGLQRFIDGIARLSAEYPVAVRCADTTCDPRPSAAPNADGNVTKQSRKAIDSRAGTSSAPCGAKLSYGGSSITLSNVLSITFKLDAADLRRALRATELDIFRIKDDSDGRFGEWHIGLHQDCLEIASPFGKVREPWKHVQSIVQHHHGACIAYGTLTCWLPARVFPKPTDFDRFIAQMNIRMLTTGRPSCPECGFDLRGNPDHGCPECGWRRGEAKSQCG
jgi:hypothetical protein